MLVKSFLTIVFLSLLSSAGYAQTRHFSAIANFDGGKFAARYGLKDGDFWIQGGELYLFDSAVVPDNPPVQETSDPTAALRTQAKAILAASGGNKIILKAILVTIVDQINVLRAAAKLSPITYQDALSAIQSNIDAGKAD